MKTGTNGFSTEKSIAIIQWVSNSSPLITIGRENRKCGVGRQGQLSPYSIDHLSYLLLSFSRLAFTNRLPALWPHDAVPDSVECQHRNNNTLSRSSWQMSANFSNRNKCDAKDELQSRHTDTITVQPWIRAVVSVPFFRMGWFHWIFFLLRRSAVDGRRDSFVSDGLNVLASTSNDHHIRDSNRVENWNYKTVRLSRLSTYSWRWYAWMDELPKRIWSVARIHQLDIDGAKLSWKFSPKYPVTLKKSQCAIH